MKDDIKVDGADVPIQGSDVPRKIESDKARKDVILVHGLMHDGKPHHLQDGSLYLASITDGIQKQRPN